MRKTKYKVCYIAQLSDLEITIFEHYDYAEVAEFCMKFDNPDIREVYIRTVWVKEKK